MSDEVFPIDLEHLLATVAEVLKGQGKARERELLILAKARVTTELVDYDNWNGGTYGWGLRCTVDLKLYGSIKSEIDAISATIRETAAEFFRAFENHSLARVLIVAEPIKNPTWRQDAERSLSAENAVGQAVAISPRPILRYPAEWKFLPEEECEPVPPALLEILRQHVFRMTSGTTNDKQEILEVFKEAFAAVAGSSSLWSSSYEWAVTDLTATMDAAAANSATFLDAYWSATQAIDAVGVPCPSLETLNKLLVTHGSSFEIRPPDLVKRKPMTKPVSIRSASDALPPSASDVSGAEFRQKLEEQRGFRLLERIGSGLSGTVYRARHLSLNRDVAVKCCDGPERRNEKVRQRFIREARLLALVQHPGIPYVITAGVIGDLAYTVMQYIDGQSLRTRLTTKGRLGLDEACRMVRSVLQALARAHEKRVVHRDIKPENILLSADGAVYVIDFSIGASLDQVPGLTGVTGQDNVPGTVDYMAPELLRGEPWDHRIDIYSTGVVLYEATTGRRCSASTLVADLGLLPADIAKVVATACAPQVSRYAEVSSFINDLARFAERQWDRGAPGAALCKNIRCPAASWTRGFQPIVLKDSTDRHCRTCGNELSYPCERCGRPYDGGRCCPGCGAEFYEVPTCLTCGAPLKQRDVRRDTKANGCSQCELPF